MTEHAYEAPGSPVRVVHGELLDEHGKFFVKRRDADGASHRSAPGGDPAAADAAEWHHGFEVPDTDYHADRSRGGYDTAGCKALQSGDQHHVVKQTMQHCCVNARARALPSRALI